MASPPADIKSKDQTSTHKPLQPLRTAPNPQHPIHHRRTSTTGITDDTAQTAHDFVSSTTRRLSDAQSPHSPGLTDELMQQTHTFWDSTATRRKSHSKYLPDGTVPGMTDQVVGAVGDFVKVTEGESAVE